MNDEWDLCGAMTSSGMPCQRRAGRCAQHAERATTTKPVAEHDEGRERNLRRLAWEMVERVLDGSMGVREATALASLGRLLHRLGPEPADVKEELLEVERRARLMAGIPPRTAEEWAWAERSFRPDAVEEFRRWEKRHRELYGEPEQWQPWIWEDEDGDEA
ncbi:MAG: hypothetical protein ACKVVT_09855 [Dehalococcoidia bacterium]